jgi:hypothetical protein
MSDAMFWLSLVLIIGCLLLCLQKEKRVVPLIRKASPWAWHIPIISVVFALAVMVFFGLAVSLESAVTVYATIFANATVIYFLFRLAG